MSCSTIGGTSAEGRKMSTVSYGIGTASSDGNAFSPRISVAVGFTGMIRYPFICMYFGTRCASFAGSFEQPTTAIVLISPRILRICVSSTIGPRLRKRAFRLRFLREDASNRVFQTRRETQMLRFVRGEPPDLRVLVVRDPRLASPSCDEEQVMAEKLLRRGIDVFVDPKEPGLEHCDA